ncbi:MAG TPA: cell division protein FtsH, partial [Armatimonadota bacterium]
DKELRAIIEMCYTRAKEILTDNREKVEAIVKVLLERETLERPEFEALMRGETVAPLPEPPSGSPGTPPATTPSKRGPEVVPKLDPQPA